MEVNDKFKTFQGDVDIFSVDSIPQSAKLLDTKTVMEGEKTGHHHTFGGQVLVYEPIENDTVMIRTGEMVQVMKYIDVHNAETITHQEHASQVIPNGMYAILKEREWDVLENQLRPAMD